MKVISHKPKPSFEPFSIEIVVETELDKDVITNLSRLNISIPELVSKEWSNTEVRDKLSNQTIRRAVTTFLQSLYNTTVKL